MCGKVVQKRNTQDWKGQEWVYLPSEKLSDSTDVFCTPKELLITAVAVSGVGMLGTMEAKHVVAHFAGSEIAAWRCVNGNDRRCIFPLIRRNLKPTDCILAANSAPFARLLVFVLHNGNWLIIPAPFSGVLSPAECAPPGIG